MFSRNSTVIIYGKHLDVVQRMLDFDYISDRTPSISGIIDPNTKQNTFVKVFFGGSEILVPIYPSFSDIPEDITPDTCINLASFRSATEVTWQALQSERFQHIVIIAEGIPERDIREIIAYNNSHKKIRIIGPATSGAIVAGTLRMGNSGGSLDNIVASRLYKKGSVGFVSRSGGMSNEMFRVIAKRTNGIHTGIALGGDRFVGSTFQDIVLDYEANPEIEMIVLLGEVGSKDELEVVELLKNKKITKPVVAYVSGSFAEMIHTEVQFGHAGAKANTNEEKASYKNIALREAGAYVPKSYADFGDLIEQVAQKYGIHDTELEDNPEIQKKLQIIASRKSTRFTSTISDERGDNLMYNNRSIQEYVQDGSIAKVIGALWFKRELPEYALNYINTILILLADHGPAVCGATNTIITARAGKDILSSLVAGLMTIGPRFGGAIDDSAKLWWESVNNRESPESVISRMKKSGIPIPGIGHKVKSKFNPDERCNILKSLAKNIPSNTYLTYALEVEKLTLEKKPNLILNVDGHIAASLLDILTSIHMPKKEISLYIDSGICNAFFILARSIGFIGHALDQKRLGEGLYRTPWEDIYYTN